MDVYRRCVLIKRMKNTISKGNWTVSDVLLDILYFPTIFFVFLTWFASWKYCKAASFEIHSYSHIANKIIPLKLSQSEVLYRMFDRSLEGLYWRCYSRVSDYSGGSLIHIFHFWLEVRNSRIKKSSYEAELRKMTSHFELLTRKFL